MVREVWRRLERNGEPKELDVLTLEQSGLACRGGKVGEVKVLGRMER